MEYKSPRIREAKLNNGKEREFVDDSRKCLQSMEQLEKINKDTENLENINQLNLTWILHSTHSYSV